MSGSFNYPREEHHLVVNYNDEVIVDWRSDFANQLLVHCEEGAPGQQTYGKSNPYPKSVIAADQLTSNEDYTFDGLNQTATERWSPLQLSRSFNQWTIPAGCEFAIYQKGGGGITGAKIGVTSAATQSASIRALSSTVPYDPMTTPSATSSPSATSTSSAISTLIVNPSSTLPTFISTNTPIPSTNGSSRLSAGAKAGIGAGIGVGALLIAAAALLFYRNYRKMKDLNARVSQYSEAQDYSKPTGVTVASYTSTEYVTPYRHATTRSEGHELVETPAQELEDTRLRQ